MSDEKLARAHERIAALQAELAASRAEAKRLRRRVHGAESFDASRLVWVFGSGRTGSTWLAAMLAETPEHEVWFEPRVGRFFDPHRGPIGGENYVFSPQYKSAWIRHLRALILDGAAARFRDAKVLFIKEPGGSVGARWLLAAVPESRVVLLLRDPRDAVASWLDAVKETGWARARDGLGGALAASDPVAYARRRAEAYLREVDSSKRAYDNVENPKALVRYEELRADALGTMKRMYASLQIPVNEEELKKAVQKHSWENIPEEEKGEGKFYRKASPGSWKEDLTPEQVGVVESITAPLLEEFYSR